jgi:hypothetical protein
MYRYFSVAFRKICFDKKGLKFFVWTDAVMAFGDVVVELHAFQTLVLDESGEWLTSESR